MKPIIKKKVIETTKTKVGVADWVIDIIAEKVPIIKIMYNLKKLTK